MRPVRRRREHALHPPPKLHSVGGPVLVPELGAAGCELAQAVDVPEEQLVGAADALHRAAVFGPVQLGDEGFVGF
jgi:hypothetical protein